MKRILPLILLIIGLSIHYESKAQFRMQSEPKDIKLADIRWRDMCILPDPGTKTYYMVGPGGRGVGCYTSKDLRNWYGPTRIYNAPQDVWGEMPIVSIWAPEMHNYKGKYYLFLTFDTRNKLCEQWFNWERNGRVTRGSQIFVGDSPTGPFASFRNHSTLPVDMMTLDGTLWVEDGTPYIVFCHEWVQITNGSICYMQLKDDLSETVGEPIKLFHASEASWSNTGKQYGNNVTDGCYLYKGKTGKLYMLWTSGGKGGYTQGIAISESGKLAGPWTQQDKPLYNQNGGHGMVFKSFDGKIMMILHSPNDRESRPRIFEMEDTGNTLVVVKELTE
ncbi:MAG: glycoside hydrolase family 43 protein [Bacteroidales bacterium]|nr:glycoside hydrolase family 43 protein [Bacteroidales bacterium]